MTSAGAPSCSNAGNAVAVLQGTFALLRTSSSRSSISFVLDFVFNFWDLYLSTVVADNFMPRLHQDTCRPELCIPEEQLVSGIRIHICRRIHVAGYKLLVRDSCRLYLSDIINIHLCHGRLVSICIQQQTSNKLATISIQDTC